MITRLPILALALLAWILGSLVACETGFETQRSRGGDDDDSAEEDDARAEAELAGHSGDSAQQGHAYTTLATLALPAGLRGAYTATAGVVRCFVSETKPAAARSTGAAAGARSAVASGASGAVRGQRKFGVVMLSESEEMRIIATQASRRFI